ncbi:hypothetical protein P8A22_04695 [Streptomyces laculatispora]|uniref:Uncharacterized protein n=1 Tax=Streptomyces laculatispora TaxID=887464 RepID=A0ABY9HYK2_9ACTN|nr:hypothetical protein [Streptomyces laculatispora]WLQ39386.1 hypothetical protein P8A22_04695 [Streptomyces laculatispora]
MEPLNEKRDLAPGDGATAVRRTPEPLTAALDEAISALSSLAHSGLRQASGASRTRIIGTATALSRTGLTRASALLRAVLHALEHGGGLAPTARGDTSSVGGSPGGGLRTGAWPAARLHLLVSSELLAAEGL